MMRILLDENLPRKLKRDFNHRFEVVTVSEQGWSGTKNGELLGLAEGEFEVFVTMDRGIHFQQNLQYVDLGFVFLSAVSNAYEDLAPLMAEVNAVLEGIQTGAIIRVGA
ncbi:MAG: putative nuclease of putative toxin-antitoxin system [Candidatus Latescibacterota bacterium]|jgi:predicted nuclease of predicted toxin-antitoxin system